MLARNSLLARLAASAASLAARSSTVCLCSVMSWLTPTTRNGRFSLSKTTFPLTAVKRTSPSRRTSLCSKAKGWKLGEHLLPCRLHQFHVVRVNEREIVVDRRLALTWLQAENAVRFIRPSSPTGLKIELPAPDMSQCLGFFQLRVLRRQLRLHPLTLRHLPLQVFVQIVELPGSFLDAFFEFALAHRQSSRPSD